MCIVDVRKIAAMAAMPRERVVHGFGWAKIFNVLQGIQLCPGQMKRLSSERSSNTEKKHTASNNEYRSKKPAESFSLYIAIYEAILISVITLYTMHLMGFYTAAYAFLLSLFLLLCSAVSE